MAPQSSTPGYDHAVAAISLGPHPPGVIDPGLPDGTMLRGQQMQMSESGGIVDAGASAAAPSKALRRVLAPLALAQFICSFAGSNMNVMITDISEDLDTTVQGVQIAITLFLLVMAALMIPGGKLTDRYGRKRCFIVGLVVYGIGALMSALSPGLGVLIIGNSILEGIGTALLIPPVYILTTLLFTEMTSRARAFGVISALGGIGAAAGPLIGGLITSAISWRAAFIFQAVIIAVIVLLSRNITDPLPPDPSRSFDTSGAVLSALGLVLVVMGILAADTNLWLMLTQNTQWVMLLGTSFVVSAYLQVVQGHNAIETGVIFTAATLGLLVSSLAAERLARRWPQRTLILAGFILTIAGIAVLLFFVRGSSTAWAFAPGLLLIGLGLGAMLTPSVNVVQSSFPESQQGEISGLSRSVSNLGSSLGTAIAGTILVAGITATPGRAYALAMAALAVIGLVGLVAAVMLPSEIRAATAQDLPQRES